MIKFHALAVLWCTLMRCRIILVLGYGVLKTQEKKNVFQKEVGCFWINTEGFGDLAENNGYIS